tara:strand:- start:14069 stop:14584 length:516 start_codon:yes stop_codon:yes gene_type:complete
MAAATITAITSVGSLFMGAMGAYQQSRAAQAQARYQAQVAQNNATIAQQNADRIRQNMDQAEDEQRERIAQTKGSARAAMGASGLLVDDTADSTFGLIQQDIMELGEYDILKLRDNYEQEARSAEIQGINYQAQAGLNRLEASSQSPFMAAAGSLLGSAGKVAKAGKGVWW